MSIASARLAVCQSRAWLAVEGTTATLEVGMGRGWTRLTGVGLAAVGLARVG